MFKIGAVPALMLILWGFLALFIRTGGGTGPDDPPLWCLMCNNLPFIIIGLISMVYGAVGVINNIRPRAAAAINQQ